MDKSSNAIFQTGSAASRAATSGPALLGGGERVPFDATALQKMTLADALGAHVSYDIIDGRAVRVRPVCQTGAVAGHGRASGPLMRSRVAGTSNRLLKAKNGCVYAA
jgi:hypothetical protein